MSARPGTRSGTVAHARSPSGTVPEGGTGREPIRTAPAPARAQPEPAPDWRGSARPGAGRTSDPESPNRARARARFSSP